MVNSKRKKEVITYGIIWKEVASGKHIYITRLGAENEKKIKEGEVGKKKKRTRRKVLGEKLFAVYLVRGNFISSLLYSYNMGKGYMYVYSTDIFRYALTY